jgi:2-polyprenyl-6-hydroxyphenyl methylase/3-demethylubiquinone-9 3-methyltransferase
MALRWKIAQWFELRWWKNYLRNKDRTAYLNWKISYWTGLLNKISGQIKIAPGDTVADLGCGPAGIYIALPGNRVVAVDPLLDRYTAGISFFRASDFPNTEFITSTIEAFDNKGELFDVVFCMNAINHVHDIHGAFRKLHGLCKAEGAVVVSIDAHNHSFFKHLFRLIPGDILHPHQYDLEEYKKLLAVNDWKITSTELIKHEFFFDHYMLVAKQLPIPTT